MRTLKQLSLDEEKTFPKASPVLRENCYMDDILSGEATLEAAEELQRQLIAILQKAGMQLHKWCTNHENLSLIPGDGYSFEREVQNKTLGVSWNPKEDCFTFNIKIELKDVYTKREVLSCIARIFDPLGLLGPVIAKAKMFMQKLWRLNIDWNDVLPALEHQEWHQFIIGLNSVNNIMVPRRIVIENPKIIEIHGFADASENCYGAAVYCKSCDKKGTVMVKLITSKSRVAPLKCITIPRLELCAAVLLSKLVKKVLAAMKVIVTKVYLWTDSMIVLWWIHKQPIDLKQFVRNRVATIQENSNIEQWRHIRSEDNPADVLSRGIDPEGLLNYDLWWNGPDILYGDDYPWNPVLLTEKGAKEFNTELKNYLNSLNDFSDNIYSVCVKPVVHELIKFSNNYLTILRVLSYVCRFVDNCKNPLYKLTGPLTTEEIGKTERLVLRAVQEEEFRTDIRNLQLKGSVDNKSKLKSLNPFLDEHGVLRVGGRLDNSNVNFGKKHPAILPNSNYLSLIVLSYFHKKYFHVGAVGLLSLVREKFWPINGRAMCRKVVHQCIPCFKAKPVISNQLMGNLPRDRVQLDYAFNISGVDLCGPFMIKIGYARRTILQKVYICIFVCFVFKAVHIEIVSDLTSESFIAALKRFSARRGKCAKLYSDNATNFIGANKMLKQFHDLVKKPDEKLAAYLSEEGIEWKFIPPRAPNFGGLWEAAIKSFKYHFRRVIGGANVTYEEFLTVVVQIEGILNSRPLSPLSADEADFEVLTPAHFLINRPVNAIIEPDLTNLKENRLKKWQRITKFVQLFWRKWHRAYLSDLQQRGKWRFEKENIHIGDVVLLIEENLPTNKWPLGRIIEVYHGEDKKIRVVRIKTQNGIFKRSISKLCVLPMPEHH